MAEPLEELDRAMREMPLVEVLFFMPPSSRTRADIDGLDVELLEPMWERLPPEARRSRPLPLLLLEWRRVEASSSSRRELDRSSSRSALRLVERSSSRSRRTSTVLTRTRLPRRSSSPMTGGTRPGV